MSDAVKLTDEQRRVVARQYARYMAAQQTAKREAQVLDDLCTGIVGSGYVLSVENNGLVLRIGDESK